ncbi:FG-GAP repeat protein [Shinella sp. BYT-45]|uniref:FG-GAP repeat protein n=1 Tax=Shinella sp. BYT-45 TaxID=3377377 RepID=UPI00397FEB06
MKSLAAALLLSAGLPAVAAAADFPADRIIAMASGDWNKDGTPDLALVATPGADGADDNGLYVYLAKPEANRLTLALALPNSVWGNLTMSGQEPELTALANGSFTLTTKNEAIGRERWRETLTIAYRNFDFIVAGYTYASYDTIAEDGGENSTSDCDLNILTGKGKSNGQAVAGKPQFVLLRDWNNGIPRSTCGLDN